MTKFQKLVSSSINQIMVDEPQKLFECTLYINLIPCDYNLSHLALKYCILFLLYVIGMRLSSILAIRVRDAFLKPRQESFYLHSCYFSWAASNPKAFKKVFKCRISSAKSFSTVSKILSLIKTETNKQKRKFVFKLVFLFT